MRHKSLYIEALEKIHLSSFPRPPQRVRRGEKAGIHVCATSRKEWISGYPESVRDGNDSHENDFLQCCHYDEMNSDKLVRSVIASEAWQSCCCNLLKTKDCFVTPFLAMTVFRTFYEGVNSAFKKKGGPKPAFLASQSALLVRNRPGSKSSNWRTGRNYFNCYQISGSK